MVTEAIPSTNAFPTRKSAALFYGVSHVTIGRWLRRGKLAPGSVTAPRLQSADLDRYPVARMRHYPIRTGPNWIALTEMDQVARLGLRRWQRLAADADAAIAGL